MKYFIPALLFFAACIAVTSCSKPGDNQTKNNNNNNNKDSTTTYTTNAVVSTFAGTGQPGKGDGAVTVATFYQPQDLVLNSQGTLCVNDWGNHLIRQISTLQIVTTVNATINLAAGIGADAQGNFYMTNATNQATMYKISPAGVVDTIPGDYVLAWSGYDVQNITLDAAGNIYTSIYGKNLILKITPAGVVSILAGSGYPGSSDGTGAQASFNDPAGIVADAQGNIYVADQINATIRKVTPQGVVTTIAGTPTKYGSADGQGAKALFGAPMGA